MVGLPVFPIETPAFKVKRDTPKHLVDGKTRFDPRLGAIDQRVRQYPSFSSPQAFDRESSSAFSQAIEPWFSIVSPSMMRALPPRSIAIARGKRVWPSRAGPESLNGSFQDSPRFLEPGRKTKSSAMATGSSSWPKKPRKESTLKAQ